MNNKAFTLVELLLTIAILGLIVAIAVPSYNGISKSIRNSQRKNKIDMIEIAASKYAFDTGESIIFVDKLVTEGYIDSDDEEGNIDDPVNKERLNCYIVEMKKTGDYYKSNFKDGKNYDNNGVCDLSKLQEDSEGVNVQVLNNNIIVNDTSSWLKGEITLKAHSNTLAIDCNTNKCEWNSSSGANKIGDEINLSNINGLLETKYTFQYTIYDDESNNIKRFKKSIDLKIDNEAPTIYKDQITVSDRFINTVTKTIKIIASDGNGSGNLKYYLELDTGQLCNSESISGDYQNSNVFSKNKNGRYIVCVKDNVGNYSKETLNINYFI